MFEDNEYMKRVRSEFGLTENGVQNKIDRMLGKEVVEVEIQKK